jgi:PAS domain S-box-containing protein
MNEISQVDFNSALAACAAEPIHQLGAIQPHGAVLVFALDDKHTIIQVSANLEQFLDCSVVAALGQSLYDLIGWAAATTLEPILLQPKTEPSTSLLLPITRLQQTLDLNGSIYATQHYWVLELYADHTRLDTMPLADQLMSLQQSLTVKNTRTSLNRYFEQITPIMREVTGYDSVMVYCFTADHDGHVIAQSKVEQAPSYLGLNFPAGDIPSQARALYTKQRVRFVANTADLPVSIVPALNPVSLQPLDLSYSALRSLSPVHIEYLINMGVAASVTISLLHDGKLWGLMIFHHLSPKIPSSDLRKLTLFTSRKVSTELTALALLEERQLENTISNFKKDLLQSILHHPEEHLLEQLSTQLMAIGEASGVILVINGLRYTLGVTPKTADIDELINWLSQQPEPEPEPEPDLVTYTYAFNKLVENYPAASAYQDIACGLLAYALNKDMSLCIIWLKKAEPSQKHWAGDPSKRLIKTLNGDFRLRPRSSFESLQIKDSASCSPWSAMQIKSVQALSITLIETLAYKTNNRQEEVEKQRLHQLTLTVELKRLKTLDELKKITDQLPGAVFQLLRHIDGQFSIPYASAHINLLFGLPPAHDNEDASELFARIHPDDLVDCLAKLTKSAENNSIHLHQFRIVFDDDTLRWLECSALPENHFDVDSPISWYGYLSDITEQKQLSEALEQSEYLWKHAIDGIGDGVYDWNLLTNEMYYSPRWKTMLGYNEEDDISKYASWEKLLHPDYLQETTETIHAYLSGNIPEYEVEFPLRTKQDDYLWILSRGTIVSRDPLGKPLRMIGTHVDISLRKSIELKLKEEQNMLVLSQSIAKLGNWSTLASTGVISWSEEMYVIFGINKADFGHNLSALVALTHPEDRHLLTDWIEQLTQPSAITTLNVRIVRPDGQLRYIKTYGTVEYTENLQVLRRVGCTQDITESILREQQDHLHLDQLAHITRLGLMGEMATGIAHEVNQPLTATVNYASALKVLASADEPDLEKITKVASLVSEQALRAGKIIHRMRSFCQNQNTSSTSTDINTLIKDSVLLCSSDLKKHNITLHLELAESLPLLFIDSIKIEQVLINLIRNSTEALHAKDSLPKTITVSSLMLEKNQLQIQVRDNGSGIEPALQEQLFMPFVTTKTEGMGMGMGLSICRSLITAHHGTLTFDSQPGLGTCFYITLPVVK